MINDGIVCFMTKLKKYSIFILLFIVFKGTFSVLSQTTTVKTLTYSTLVMTPAKLLIKNKSLGIKVSIYKVDQQGDLVYSEKLTGKTNQIGNITIDVGLGYVLFGKFSSLDVGKGGLFIRLDVDPNGGDKYAFDISRDIANVAKGLTSTFRFSVTTKTIVRRFIGELFGGGIIFHLSQDSLGNQHGLITSLHDLSKNAKWGLMGVDYYGFKDAINGRSTSNAMIKAGAEKGTASKLCYEYTNDGHKDWYLPSLRELQMIYAVRDIIDKTLDGDKLEKTKGFERKHYWSSTGYSGSTSWFFSFYNGGATNYGKNFLFNVRAIRAF